MDDLTIHEPSTEDIEIHELQDEKDARIIDKVSEILIERNMLWQYDDVIESEITDFLKENKYSEERLFEVATQRQEDSKYWTLLAFLNVRGMGIPSTNDKKAFYWYHKAASELNDPLGLQETGVFYYHGKGVKINNIEANYWFKKAAEVGMGIAQHRLAINYLKGRGIEVDHAEGFKWLLRSANAGFVEAMDSLTDLYLNGIYTKKNNRLALFWAEKSYYEFYSRTGLYNLMHCYRKGLGTCMDMHKTIFLAVHAKRNGHDTGYRKLVKLFDTYFF
ncbi:11831_t:CDS:1 [Ambispora leptoticha]|uniref:11831_t:CDS:1 n=1 Tax=Ambispora leptoticha TaxID=144679 RepID=A0A9N8WLK0_9GLOM|nr:11831_t:CDS:1 [Ambispora leptoticha]